MTNDISTYRPRSAFDDTPHRLPYQPNLHMAAAQEPEQLIRCSDNELRELITENLRHERTGPGLWTVLTKPPLVARTRGLLIAMQMGVDSDIRARRRHRDERRARVGVDHSSAYEQDYRRWHGRAVTFRQLVQDRVAQTRVGATEDNSNKADILRWHRSSVCKLVEAIARHRRALNSDVHPEPCDSALWEVLNEVTVPFGPKQCPVPVRDMFDRHWDPDRLRQTID